MFSLLGHGSPHCLFSFISQLLPFAKLHPRLIYDSARRKWTNCPSWKDFKETSWPLHTGSGQGGGVGGAQCLHVRWRAQAPHPDLHQCRTHTVFYSSSNSQCHLYTQALVEEVTITTTSYHKSDSLPVSELHCKPPSAPPVVFLPYPSRTVCNHSLYTELVSPAEDCCKA